MGYLDSLSHAVSMPVLVCLVALYLACSIVSNIGDARNLSQVWKNRMVVVRAMAVAFLFVAVLAAALWVISGRYKDFISLAGNYFMVALAVVNFVTAARATKLQKKHS